MACWNRLGFPVFQSEYATRSPFGDHTGSQWSPGSEVSLVKTPRGNSINQICTKSGPVLETATFDSSGDRLNWLYIPLTGSVSIRPPLRSIQMRFDSESCNW
jgi:hypothetical protein